jgi:hypothetical protein
VKYNPDYHKSVVDNVRRAYKDRYGQETTFTDEQLWDTHSELSGGGLSDDDVLEEIHEGQEAVAADQTVNLQDINGTSEDHVEIELQERETGAVLYVHRNGLTVCRICRLDKSKIAITGFQGPPFQRVRR